MIKRTVAAASLASLALSGTALAAGTHGTLLSVNRKAHTIEVVDGGHQVHAYHYRGKLPALKAGARLTFRRSGSTISAIRASRGSSVTFLARVEQATAKTLHLRLGDGRNLSLSTARLTAAKPAVGKHPNHLRRAFVAHMALGLQLGGGGVTVNIEGLQPGLTVLVTQGTDQNGNPTITITLPPPASPAISGEQASGVIARLGRDSFMLATADGSLLRMHMATSALDAASLSVCDTADVTYHQDNELLIVDSATKTGTSTTGDCASGDDSGNDGNSGSGSDGNSGSGSDGSSGSGSAGGSAGSTAGGSAGSSGGDATGSGDQDATGTIKTVSGSALEITTDGGQTMDFVLDDANLASGFAAGDVVDVTYRAAGTTLGASDVEYVEQDATGAVTKVSDGSLTLAPSGGGKTQTFSADPSQGVFSGVASGDSVDVTFHIAGGQPVADLVTELGSAAG